MPFQEYICDQCGHEFKRLYFAGDPVKDPACPQCGHAHPRRDISCQPLAEPSPFLDRGDAPKGCGPSSGFS